MNKYLKVLFKKFQCMIGHDWTCAALEGVKATDEQLNDGIDGFWDYAKMYCKRCGKIYTH